MNTPTKLAQLCAVVVLVAPLGLLGAEDESMMSELGLTKYVEPEFPAMARYDGYATGVVTLAVSQDARGIPKDILVLASSHPLMGEAAVNAVREWRFLPSDNLAGPPARTIRIGFKLMGVVVFPYGKNHIDEPSSSVSPARLSEQVRVPRVHTLAPNPRPLVQTMPEYPSALVARKVEGTAVVKFFIDEEGRVRLPELIEATTPEFAEAALAAVARWRYEPPQQGGRRIVAAENWTFKFAANN